MLITWRLITKRERSDIEVVEVEDEAERLVPDFVTMLPRLL
jgi:hypothetical protein